jgi:hypothetical protein
MNYSVEQDLSTHDLPPFKAGISKGTLHKVTFEPFIYRGGTKKDEETKCLRFAFLDEAKDRQQDLVLLFVDVASEDANDDMLYTQKTIKQIFDCYGEFKGLKAKTQEELFAKAAKMFEDVDHSKLIYLKVFFNKNAYLSIPSKYTNYAFIEAVSMKDKKPVPTTLYVNPQWDLMVAPEKKSKSLTSSSPDSGDAADEFGFVE